MHPGPNNTLLCRKYSTGRESSGVFLCQTHKTDLKSTKTMRQYIYQQPNFLPTYNSYFLIYTICTIVLRLNELTFKKSKKAGLVAQDFLRIPTAVLKLFTYSLYASNTIDLENWKEKRANLNKRPLPEQSYRLLAFRDLPCSELRALLGLVLDIQKYW